MHQNASLSRTVAVNVRRCGGQASFDPVASIFQMNEDVFGWVIIYTNVLLNKYVSGVRGIRLRKLLGVEFWHVFCPSHRDDVGYVQRSEQRSGAGCKTTNAIDQPNFYIAADV